MLKLAASTGEKKDLDKIKIVPTSGAKSVFKIF
jgi:hypothetical protein